VRKFEVTYEPSGRVVHTPEGTTLFNAAHWVGLAIESTCGGRGTCGKCKVKVLEGDLDPTPEDHRELPAEEITQGWRLACKSEVHADHVCEIPQLMKAPKAATAGVGRLVLLDPSLVKVHLELSKPTLEETKSDFQRVSDALDLAGYGGIEPTLEVLRSLPDALRADDFDVTAVVSGKHLVAVEPGDTCDRLYGVAVDVGTTTVVATLMDLRTGMAVGASSGLNRQAAFGADVISRINHSMSGSAAVAELQEAAVGTINSLLHELYREFSVERDNVYEAVVAGNATMLHLLLRVGPQPIALSPFVAAFLHPLDLRAAPLGLDIHPEGRVQTFPSLGAYVGADIVSDVLATGMAQEDTLRLLVDVGTNGEAVLGSAERAVATSAPAGPAFEGAHVRAGMRATEGAIEGVVLGEDVRLQIVGGNDLEPQGLCGSGLIDLVAQLRVSGMLDEAGRMLDPAELKGHPLAARIVEHDGARSFQLTDQIYVTQPEIRELQSAKGAVAAGIDILMEALGIAPEDVEEVLLAGAFGTYINPESARTIGLVPAVPLERIKAVGNTASEGAKMALLSFREREIGFELPKWIEYIELSADSGFNDRFIDKLRFPPIDKVTIP